MDDIINQIAAGSPETVAMLLQAMGQTTRGQAQDGQAYPAVPAGTDPMNLPNVAAAEALLRSMGQMNMPGREPIAVPDAMWNAQGAAMASMLPKIDSVAAAQALLASMGQTGMMQQPPADYSNEGYGKGVSSPSGRLLPGAIPLGSTEGNASAPNPTSGISSGRPMDAFFREMTGVANTEGGIERVNQYTVDHGVTASKDPKTGRITLTNIDPTTRKPTPQSQVQLYGFSPLGASSSASVNALSQSLRQTQDPDAARGIISSLNESLAIESARIEAESNKFAENKLGVPKMEQTLAAAEALDRSAPGYQQGMGDSKNTAAIRQQLYVARQQANGVAKDWLQSNLGYAQLKAAAANATAEGQRITRLADAKMLRKERSLDAVAALSEKNEAAKIAAYDGLSDLQRSYILQLNPALRSVPDNRAEMVRFADTQWKNDPAFKELMSSPPERVPALAIMGNQHAANVLAAEEMEKANVPPEQTKKALDEIKALSKGGTSIRSYVDMQVERLPSGVNRPKERERLLKEYTDMTNSKDKSVQVSLRDYQTAAAVASYQAKRTSKFVSDVTTWGANDPDLMAAANVAKTKSGKTDIASTVAAYVGDKTGPEALARYEAFRQKILAASGNGSKSVFGGIDTSAAIAAVNAHAAQQGTMAKWFRDQWNAFQESEAINNSAMAYGVQPAALWGGDLYNGARTPNMNK